MMLMILKGEINSEMFLISDQFIYLLHYKDEVHVLSANGFLCSTQIGKVLAWIYDATAWPWRMRVRLAK